MDNLVIGIVLAVVILAIPSAIVYFLVRYIRKVISSYVDPYILENSRRIMLLDEINNKYSFDHVQNRFYVDKHYDNKRNYLKNSPSDIFAHELRSNLDYYLNVVQIIKNNKEIYQPYKTEIEDIPAGDILDAGKLAKIPDWVLVIREKKIFDDKVKKPQIDLGLYVEMRYSSPKGRVNLHKEQFFTLKDFEVCLGSISRARLSRKDYLRITSVERSEISDSLRYDILNRDGFKCVLCGAAASQGVVLHVDHIVPISRGGKSTKSNLRTLCERCNIGKSDKIEISPSTKVASQDVQSGENAKNYTCPWCSGKLVWRKGKYGEFLGCSNYPDCRFTKNTVVE